MLPKNMTPIRHFRVVGIRQDESRVVVRTGLTAEEAKSVRDQVAAANVFGVVVVEFDTSADSTSP